MKALNDLVNSGSGADVNAKNKRRRLTNMTAPAQELVEFARVIKRGDLIRVESLIAPLGTIADLNARLPVPNEEPPLVLAARFGRKAIVEVLLKAGARVGTTCRRHGMTALHAAAQEDAVEIVNVLLAHSSASTLR